MVGIAALTGDQDTDDAVARLRAFADGGDPFAAYRLTDVLVEQGLIDDAVARLRGFADGGNPFAAYRLADLLAERERVDELTRRHSMVRGPPIAGSPVERSLLHGSGQAGSRASSSS